MVNVLIVGDAFFNPEDLRQLFERKFPGKISVRTEFFSFPESEYPIDPDMAIPSGMLMEDPKKRGSYPDAGVREFYGNPFALSGKVRDTEVLVIHGAALPAAVIDGAEQLKAVIVLRGGPENIAIGSLRERGIRLLQTSGKNADGVAEFTLGALLDFERGFTYGNALLLQNRWWIKSLSGRQSRELRRKTFGFVGYGRIARSLRQLLTGFSARVLAYDPYVDAATMNADDVEPVTLKQLLRTADYVSLHARAKKGEPPMMGAEQFALMRPDAVLINSARGALLDYRALEEALEQKKIRGAVLDVLGDAPFSDYQPLIRRPDVLVTPHIAGHSRETVERGYAMAVDLLGDYLAIRKP
ncbi:MAG: hypothetical protein LBR29_10630 [Methylobacteriaceae bacterium]|nr:hypothetical protein [Methylobacteriaceae bacterium]